MMRNILFISLAIVLSCCTKLSDSVVGIQPFGNLNPALVDTIKHSIEDVYGFKVEVLSDRKLPQTAFIHLKSPRYRADSIIRLLKREKPDDIDFVIGILNKDISTTKHDKQGNIKTPTSKYADWGVFGLGYRPGPSCVISTYRIKSADHSLYISRLKKICAHELGHNMGLKHCKYSEKCVMRDAAEKISTVDNVNLRLCSRCKSKVE